MKTIYDYKTIESAPCYTFGATEKLGMALTLHTADGDVALEYIKDKMRFYLDQKCCAIAKVEDAVSMIISLKNWHKQFPNSNDLPKSGAMYNIGLILGGGCNANCVVELKGNDDYNFGRSIGLKSNK